MTINNMKVNISVLIYGFIPTSKFHEISKAKPLIKHIFINEYKTVLVKIFKINAPKKEIKFSLFKILQISFLDNPNIEYIPSSFERCFKKNLLK